MATVALMFDAETRQVRMQRSLPVPNRTEVLLALKDQGYGDCVVDEAALKQALTPPAGNDSDWVAVAQKRNGELQLLVSADHMSVTLDLTSPQGGTPVSAEHIFAAFRDQGICYGISSDAVNELLTRSREAAPGNTVSAVVAEGKWPVDGDNSRFESLVVTIKDRILKPRESDDGSIDYFDLGDIPTVQAGTPLMRRHPPTAGEAGSDVFGNMMAATPGKALDFDPGEGVAISADDADLLIATAGGMPVPRARGMAVENVYRIDNVSTETGHVKFDGSVYVTGDVGMHLKVESGADVTVGGFVDTATLNAGGDVLIGKGITGGFAGNVNQLQAHAHADHHLWVRFAQFAELDAGEDVLAEKMLLHCKVHSGGAVKVGPEGVGAGKLVGGEIHAGDFVKTDILGAENEIHTVVILGEKFAELKQLQRDQEALINKQQLVVRNLQTLLDKPERQGDAELKARIKATYDHTMQQILQLQTELLKQNQQWQDLIERTRVIVTRKLHKGCEITIGDKTWKVTSDYGPGTVIYTAHGLQFKPGIIGLPKPKS